MLAEQIKNKQYLEETIKTLKQENSSADIQLLEKTIGALYLIESLANENIDFIFKGGTSLVLLLKAIKRFSVDVDIITDENEIKKYSGEVTQDIEIPKDYRKWLKVIRKINEEAYYYIIEALRIK